MTKHFAPQLLRLALMPVLLTAMTACGGTTTQEIRPTAASPVQPSPTAVAPIEVRITLTEFAIESSQTTFQTGVPYRFVIDSAGTLAHDFRITPRGESQSMINMPSDGHDHQHDNELMIVKESELAPGTTYSKDITFEQPGEFEFACHVAGHLAGGMLLPVDVTGRVVSMPTRIAPDSIRYDPAMMPGMACHAMGVTIAGDCTPEDVERIKAQILEKEAALLETLGGGLPASPTREGAIVGDADPAQLDDHHDGTAVDDHGHEPAATPTASG